MLVRESFLAPPCQGIPSLRSNLFFPLTLVIVPAPGIRCILQYMQASPTKTKSTVTRATPPWHLYILRCRNGALYTGIALNVAQRLARHQQGKGAKYLRGRGPLLLVFKKALPTRGLALRVESRIKKLTRSQKEALLRQTNLIRRVIDDARRDQ